MDPAILAQAAIAFVVPWLQQTGTKALEKIQGTTVDAVAAAPGKVYGWLKEKLAHHPVASAALAELPSQPGDETTQKTLELQLTKILKENEALRAELERLLPSQPVATFASQSAVAAAGSKIAQVAGVDNKVNIS